ncbi:MAG: ABC transporter permease [Acholeplasmataceae bacterium]|jgi:spermidine/putrescine transport system permease protein|nr:ABC transporter permease [Acholeplasmataceae bacterium]
MNKNIFRNVFLFIIYGLLYLPIISMIIFSFNSNNSFTRFGSFSLKWYVALFRHEKMMQAVLVTIVVAIISTIISTIIGTFAAIALSKQKKVLRNLTLMANNIPVINPEIITAISLFVLFGIFQIPKGYLTMLLAHIAFSTPYVIITVYPKVISLDPNLSDAASDLGATPFQTLTKVILPQIKVAIGAGAAIAFTMSFDDFVISYFVTIGSGVSNISTYLYTLKRAIDPKVNALSALICLVIGLKITYDYFISGPKKIKKERLKG